METLHKILNYIKEKELYPEMKTVCTAPSAVVEIEKKKMHMFCTNNYLNLATHPKVIEASVLATKKYGTGAGGSRLISGTNQMHVALEKEISILKGREDTLVFSSGYLANIGAISAIANPLLGVAREISKEFMRSLDNETIVFSDELNHASIIDACKIAKVPCIQYNHTDMSDLKKKLLYYKTKRKIIVTDGVFSMDGDIAPLPDIVELAKEFHSLTIVDDAHGTGILGENGGGTAEYFNLKGEIDLEVGTLNKVFGGVGGFVSGNKEICELLRVTSRPYIFSAAMPPGNAAGLVEAVKIVKDEPALRIKLFENIDYFQKILNKNQLSETVSSTPIIPIIIGDENLTVKLSNQLFEKGFFVPAIRWPAVPKGEARFRVTLMTDHTKDQMDAFVETLNTLCINENVLVK